MLSNSIIDSSKTQLSLYFKHSCKAFVSAASNMNVMYLLIINVRLP